jgi:putative ABC transport system permease protein
MALSSIKASKLRSFLTMVAVIIGVGAFILITTTIDGLKSAAAGEINDLGGNLVTINSGEILYKDEQGKQQLNFAASIGASTLTEKDFNDVRALNGVRAAAPQILISGVVQKDDQTLNGALIMATTSDYTLAFNQKISEGEFFQDDSTRFIVVGSGVVDELFPGGNAIGRQLKIRGEDFVIVGVMEEFTSSSLSFGVDINKSIFIPIEAAKQFTGGVLPIMEIDIQLDEEADPEDLTNQMDAILLANHGGEHDFTVLKQEELIELTGDIFSLIKSASQAVSSIMLFVGAIVILLVMLIAVNERIKEIGVRKSIGATNSNILSQFLIEALVLTWFGSVLGIIFAWALGFLVKSTVGITPEYSLNTIITIAVISTIIGALAGIYPAWQAARKDPVEALRHD